MLEKETEIERNKVEVKKISCIFAFSFNHRHYNYPNAELISVSKHTLATNNPVPDFLECV